MSKKLGTPSMNYDFKQKAPKKPMGGGAFANMPESPIMRPFNSDGSLRGGDLNNPAYGIDETSGVDEMR